VAIDFSSIWDFQDPEGSLVRFQAKLASAGDVDSEREIRTQIARCHGLMRNFEAAHIEIDAVLAEVRGSQSVAELRALLEKGRTLRSSGFPAEALPCFQAADDLALQLGEDALAVDALHMIALVDIPARSEEHHLVAIARAQASADPAARKWLASLSNNLGWTYFEEGLHEESLAQFRIALAEREAMGNQDNTEVAKWCVAKLCRVTGRWEESNKILLELLSTRSNDYYVWEESSLLNHELGNAEQASIQARKCLKICTDHDLLSPDSRAQVVLLAQE
jgi:tetratricopeptide (TPR) repeat protein